MRTMTDNRDHLFKTEETPNFRPKCHDSIEPTTKLILKSNYGDSDTYDVIFECPHPDCSFIFISQYCIVDPKSAH